MRVPRWVVLGVILAMAVPTYAEAGRKPKKTTRSESYEYSGGSGLFLPTVSVQSCIDGQGCFVLAPRKSEDYLLVEATDATGTPAPFRIYYNGVAENVCGTTGDPIWLNDATEVELVVGAVYLPDCQGTATSGTLDVTYSNLP